MKAQDLLDRIGAARVESFADLGGTSLPLALAAQARWDCDLVLVDLDRKGRFPDEESPWIAPYRAALIAGGIDAARIRIARSAADLRPCDVISNLDGFGDRQKVRHLAPVLERCLHSESRMVMDIRKGSGAFPFLRDFGRTEILWSEGEVSRVIFTPNPPVPVADHGWAAIATALAGPEGFFRQGPGHSFLFLPRGRTLVVTFDNLDIAMTKRDSRRPWGFEFIEKQGWSMLGVMAEGWTWYRDPWVWAEFDRLAAEGFFARFDRVVFYGASMGGYAACAFSAACPGADVVAISPQSTLDKALVPWETRYHTAWGRDFSGKYGDAAEVSRAAGRVMILFDPYEPLDAGHVARFAGANVLRLRAPLMGHRLGSSLQQMGILSPIILSALEGSLTEAAFYRRLRARRDFGRYHRELFLRALDRGHPRLARLLGEWVLRRGENRFIRLRLHELPRR